jgi:hypothetical protein
MHNHHLADGGVAVASYQNINYDSNYLETAQHPFLPAAQ